MSHKDAAALPAELGDAEVDRLLRLIDGAGYDDVDLEIGDLKISIRKSGVPTAGERRVADLRPSPSPVPAAARAMDGGAASPAPAVATASAVVEIPPGLIAVRAPVLGTFYGSPSPGAPRFAQVGQHVSAEDTVCLIEVMKIFNSVPAGACGKIVRFLVEDGQMVEHDQPILLIEPERAAA